VPKGRGIEVCSQSLLIQRLMGRQRIALMPKQKSRAPKRGIWLMRGAQPATSAGARLFAGSPIPALLPSSMGRYRDQKTRIAISSAQVSNAHFVNANIPARTWPLACHAQYKLVWSVCRRDYVPQSVDCGCSRQSPGRTVLASKRNGPLRRAMEKRRCDKRFVHSACFCEWRLLRCDS